MKLTRWFVILSIVLWATLANLAIAGWLSASGVAWAFVAYLFGSMAGWLCAEIDGGLV